MTNLKTYLYYASICKHEHKKNMIRLWCKIVLKSGIERNERFYFYLYPFGDLAQKSFKRSFYICIE